MRKMGMSQDEYLKSIEQIRKQIKVDPEEALEALAKLENVKPVRKQWFLAKAEALMAGKHNLAEVFSALSGKGILKSNAPINQEIFQTLLRAYPVGNHLDRNRQRYLTGSFSSFEDDPDFYYSFQERIHRAKHGFLNNMNSIVAIEELARCYYIQNNMALFMLLESLKNYLNLKWNIAERSWVNKSYNMGFVIEMLGIKFQNPFIIIEPDQEDTQDCWIAANILKILGKKIYVIKKPVLCPVDNMVPMEDTLEISLAHTECEGCIKIYHSIALVNNQKLVGDNRDCILAYIVENLKPKKFAAILCSGNLFQTLEFRPSMRKFLQRLDPMIADYFEDNISFGWAGDYLAYCDFLYGFDTKAMFNAPDECDFSIVIPARNSARYLEFALKTCLRQRFQGTYEIILSDNSTDGNTEIHDLYLALNDPRIKYYRTPRELPLTRSFEFAFLQARGKFVFAIGSDDGVLPWTLACLEEILQKAPDLNVLTWERGFYAWPGFNGKQQHQLNIIRAYQKNKFSIINYDARETLTKAMYSPHSLYLLPLLYLNSGCRRSYYHAILEKTGRLWDGICQDLYMGVVNLAINEMHTVLQYPLTIAGMSNNSMGVASVVPHATNKEALDDVKIRSRVNNVGAYAQSKLEYIIPTVNFDCASFYRSFVRMVARGCISVDLLDELDWKKIYLNIAENLSREDINLEQKLDEFRFSAQLISPEFADFVEKEICQPFLEPVVFEKKVDEQKRGYTVGLLEGGGAILDASEFGVENIYDATLLFEKLTGL